MPRPRVTRSRKGSTSSGPSGPPKEKPRRASYGAIARSLSAVRARATDHEERAASERDAGSHEKREIEIERHGPKLGLLTRRVKRWLPRWRARHASWQSGLNMLELQRF